MTMIRRERGESPVPRPVPKLGSYLGSPTRDPLKLLHDFVLIG